MGDQHQEHDPSKRYALTIPVDSSQGRWWVGRAQKALDTWLRSFTTARARIIRDPEDPSGGVDAASSAVKVQVEVTGARTGALAWAVAHHLFAALDSDNRIGVGLGLAHPPAPPADGEWTAAHGEEGAAVIAYAGDAEHLIEEFTLCEGGLVVRSFSDPALHI